MKPIAIIGSGMAGYSVAREFRKRDQNTPLLIISGDAGDFYSKPMLSNAFAQNKQAGQLSGQSAAQMAEQLPARIVPHTLVSQIDSMNKTILTSAGEFNFDKLVLAVGAQPIRLAIAGDAADQVISVNHLSDYTSLRQRIAAAGAHASITLLGAGLIGCEFADDLAGAGFSVTLVDPNPLPLAALAPAPLGMALQAALERRGIRFMLGNSAARIDQAPENQGKLQITLADGALLQSDIVLSAVGLRPDLRLALASNLQTERGILLDANGQTSAADIYALGDCAQYTDPADGTHKVLPYIAPILTAARALARSLTSQITPIDLHPAAVIVKTPSYPIALVAPPAQLAQLGRWQHTQSAASIISKFYDAQDRLQGFALAPPESKLRTALLAELQENAMKAQLTAA